MIFKRFAANLRAQNWFAIALEVAIVIVGVFIGTWVANWNEERLEREETARMLDDLNPSSPRSARRFRASTITTEPRGAMRRPRLRAGQASPASATATS